MADSNRLTVKAKDVRSCRFFYRYIYKKIPDSKRYIFDINNPDVSLSNRIINDAIELYIPNPNERLLFIRNMELELSTNIISDKLFSWLENDIRATFWFWGEITLDNKCNQIINERLGVYVYTYWYEEAEIPYSPVSHSERYNAILAFFDYICFKENNAPAMRHWLNDRLNYWRKFVVNITRFKWLHAEDTEVCSWAYRSLKKHQEVHCSSEDDKLNPVQIPPPTNTEETFHAFYAMLDLWDVDWKIQQQTIEKLKKAFYQKNFRRKNAEKKGREDLSEGYMEKIDFLVRYYKLDKASVIEMLIDDRVNGIETKMTRNR